MGKGDKKSKRGKIFMGSFGVSRRARKKKTEGLPLAVKEPKVKKVAVVVEEIKKEKKEPKVKAAIVVEEPKKEKKAKVVATTDEIKEPKKESKKEPKKESKKE